MKSQYGRSPQSFSYGPFMNVSDATLTITLNQVGQSKHRFARGFVNGHLAAEGGQAATFMVPPRAEYVIRVEDSFAITAYADESGLTTAAVGLPSATDFDRPTGGNYLGCRIWLYGADLMTGLTTLYYYTPGTRSDRSSRSDSAYPPEPPPSPDTCEKVGEDPINPGGG